MKRQGLLSATGILLLGLVMLMTLHEWDSALPGQDNAVAMAPAIIADQVSARAFSEKDGSLQYHLTADSLVQFDHNPLTKMQAPVQEDGDLISFLGKVNVNNPIQKMTVNTEELHFNSDTNIATTPGDVEMRFDSGQTRAGALEADLNKGVLELKKGVKSEFEAPAS
jgi:lipopolysaccharide export system protein LptC